MSESLSIQQARDLAISSQRLILPKPLGDAKSATLAAIEHLGYIQIDTISVVERAHHHTLWNRNSRYQASQLDALLADKMVYEYWSHAAAYLPFRDFRFSLPRKHALASGAQSHWYDRDESMMKLVLDRISSEGPLMAKDFEHTGKKVGDWSPKPAKRALEYLFMQGDLMVPNRVNFHKVYDLTERVIPAGTDLSMPSPEEYSRFLIKQYLRAHGLGQAAEICYLLKNTKPSVAATIAEMTAAGELLQVKVAEEVYYALPAAINELNHSKKRRANRVKILSPFDNLVIQRKRVKHLFGFDYLIECYVPRAKRKYGYFSLPILWSGNLVARMDCKAERKESILHIHNLALEPNILKVDSFFQALAKELQAFVKFNHCKTIQVHQTTPATLKPELNKALKIDAEHP